MPTRSYDSAAKPYAASNEPMPRPSVIGQPCWTSSAVAASITSIARLDPKLTHYFLATHAPVDRILDDTRRVTIGEHDAFRRLIDPSRGDVLMVVHGEPGTGKSHLIRWLHLRCQYEKDHGQLQDLMTVLVQRRTGSLKDALEQIIEQLPGFGHHLTRIREAIGTLTADAARAVLANALQVELGPNWTNRGHSPRKAPLQQLDQLCLSSGFRAWLCRDGGVIDRVIQQLTQQSDVADRLSLPVFDAREFDLPAALQADNTHAAQALIEEFDFTPELRAQAGLYFDAALRPAIKEMSGLAGTRLRDVFSDIRRELKHQGKELAVFIEDVSVMAALDEDILNAVEPDPQQEFCRLKAVVGMTEVKLKALRDNQQSRVTDFLSLGGQVLTEWRDDSDAVARFAARYLNVVRLNEDGVRRIADGRKSGGDVGLSACDACPVRTQCHATFGVVTFGTAEVGLFPFSASAPQRLLSHLDEQRKGVRQNARGLLEHVLRPFLADPESLESHSFPRVRLAAELSVPSYWREFERKYFGNWPNDDKSRIRFLAQAWISAKDEETAAGLLEPFRSAFGLPLFTKTVESTALRSDHKDTPKASASKTRETHDESSPDIPVELQSLLDSIHGWAGGQKLTRDDEPRRLVHEFLATSIPWEQERIPRHVVEALCPDKRYVWFDDQRSRPHGLFVFKLPRTEETVRLVEALGRYNYLAKNGRAYRGIESDRRTMARWLRANGDRFVTALQPAEPLSVEIPMEQAVRTLSVAAVIRRGVGLPPDSVGLLKALLADSIDENRSASLTARESELMDQILSARASAREFVLKETNRPQGTGGILFIDPLPILRYARRTLDQASIPALPSEYVANGVHWKARFQVVAESASSDLNQLIDERRAGIKGGLARVRLALLDLGLPGDVGSEVSSYCAEMASLIDTQKRVVALDWADLNGLRLTLSIRAESWQALMSRALEVAEASIPMHLLTFPSGAFRLAIDTLMNAKSFFDRLNNEVSAQEAALNADGDPVALFEDLKNALGQIAGSAEANA